MKLKIYFLATFTLLILNRLAQAQCPSNFIKQYTSTVNMVQFKDFTNIPTNWQREYTQWDFNDGSAIDTNLITNHTFPSSTTYTVTKETRLSEIANPLNFCLAISTFTVDASLSSPSSFCYPQVKFNVKWLTGLTFGVSSYVSGCTPLYKEIAIDTGYSTALGSSAGTNVPGIFSTNQNFFTYTLPYPPYVYAFVHHINVFDPNSYSGLTPSYLIKTVDSIPTTPSNCHASFFMTPSDATLNNWTIQDFSTSSDSLSYFWDFGDGNTSTLASPSHTYATTSMYTVCLTVSNGSCSNTYCDSPLIDTTLSGHGVTTLNVQKMIFTGLAENKKQEHSVKLFPNPAHNNIEIKYPFEKEDYTITATNLLGESVLCQNVNNITSGTVILNIEDLTSGIYLLQITSKNGDFLAKTKFVKE